MPGPCLCFICDRLVPTTDVAPQVSTTKGTGGDVIILEEAAYCDPGFFCKTDSVDHFLLVQEEWIGRAADDLQWQTRRWHP